MNNPPRIPSLFNSITLAIFLFILFICQQTYAQSSCTGTLNKLNATDFITSKCLDGSPGAYYFIPSPTNNNKWMILLEGGGECVTKSTCTSRAKTGLGSSDGYAASALLGSLHSCNNNNPAKDFNKVYVKYCSGDLFYGQDNASNDRAWNLQFSGYNIIKDVIKDLIRKYNLSQAHTIMLGGLSAGGLGAVTIADDIFDFIYLSIGNQHLPYQTTVRQVFIDPRDNTPHAIIGPLVGIIPIAGYHFETNPTYVDLPRGPNDPAPIGFIPWKFEPDWRDYLTLWNSHVPLRCEKFGGIPIHHCLIAQGSYPTIISPMFVVQSTLDSVVMPLHGGLPKMWERTDDTKGCNSESAPCPPAVREYMEIWKGNITTHLEMVKHKHIVAKVFHPYLYHNVDDSLPMDGAFASACILHTEFAVTRPIVNGMSYMEAFGMWYNSLLSSLSSSLLSQGENPYYNIDICPQGEIFCGKC